MYNKTNLYITKGVTNNSNRALTLRRISPFISRHTRPSLKSLRVHRSHCSRPNVTNKPTSRIRSNLIVNLNTVTRIRPNGQRSAASRFNRYLFKVHYQAGDTRGFHSARSSRHDRYQQSTLTKSNTFNSTFDGVNDSINVYHSNQA